MRTVAVDGCALSLVAVTSASAPKPWIRLRRDGMPAPSKARVTTGEMTRKAADRSSAQGDVACEAYGQLWVTVSPKLAGVNGRLWRMCCRTAYFRNVPEAANLGTR